MATQVQNRRGTTAEHSTFTGAVGELTVDTTKDTVVVHDGSTAGGAPLLREDGSNSALALGSAASPSLKFTGDTNTGIYSPGADQVAISSNSSERIRIGANGEIGIAGANYGTSGQVLTSGGLGAAPSWTTLTVNTDKIEEGNSSAEVIDTGSDGRFVVTTEGSERLRVDSSGRLGLGTSSPGAAFDVQAGATSDSVAIRSTINTNAGAVGGVALYGGNSSGTSVAYGAFYANIQSNTAGSHSGGLRFYIADSGSFSEKMRLTPTGLGIGTQTPGGPLDVYEGTWKRLLVTYPDVYTTKLALSTGGYLQSSVADDAVRLYNTANGPTIFATNNTEKARLTADGKLLVGTSSARSNVYTGANLSTPFCQIENNTASYDQGLSLLNYSVDGYPSSLTLGVSLSGTKGTNTLVRNNEMLGRINFAGNDGTNFRSAALIEALVDGSPGSGDMPGRLVFSTTSDSASSPTERARITSGGYLKVSNNGSYFNSTGAYHEFTNTANVPALILRTTDGSQTDTTLSISPSRAANSAYKMLMCYSGNEADLEFNLRGDGNAYADGSWNGGGADYAEYFEWIDGNADEEDRRGISVVLDGNKIRPAVDGEDPIGVISGNPSVVGDTAWNKWNGKYLRDDYGSYVLDENGERQLNPAYDPDVEYISREDRPEWDCVGLMGKLRIRKGQPTGSRWIKMRDISDSVEEWLVR
jgi:hypothetical protein